MNKNKIDYQCEHCIYFKQHYGINSQMLYKVDCGHCLKTRKTIKMRKMDCEYFVPQSKEMEIKQNNEDIKNTLGKILQLLQQLKLYLYRYNETQEIDDYIVKK